MVLMARESKPWAREVRVLRGHVFSLSMYDGFVNILVSYDVFITFQFSLINGGYDVFHLNMWKLAPHFVMPSGIRVVLWHRIPNACIPRWNSAVSCQHSEVYKKIKCLSFCNILILNKKTFNE